MSHKSERRNHYDGQIDDDSRLREISLLRDSVRSRFLESEPPVVNARLNPDLQRPAAAVPGLAVLVPPIMRACIMSVRMVAAVGWSRPGAGGRRALGSCEARRECNGIAPASPNETSPWLVRQNLGPGVATRQPDSFIYLDSTEHRRGALARNLLNAVLWKFKCPEKSRRQNIFRR